MLASLASLSYLSKNTTTEPTTPPTIAPTITSISGTAATLTVNFNSGSSANITGYKYSIDNGVTFFSTSTTTSPIKITGLLPSTNSTSYNVKLIEVVNGMDSPQSNTVSGSTSTTSWASLSLGPSPNLDPQALVIKIDSNGTTYAGGTFGIYRRPSGGTAWTSLGSFSTGGMCIAMAIDISNNVIIGGNFISISTTIGNTTTTISTPAIAKYNVSNSTWSAFGGGITGTVRALAIDSNNNIYVGGEFNTVNGVTNNDYRNIVKWNGSTWSALVGGTNSSSACFSLAFDSANNVYVGGNFTTVYNGTGQTNSLTVRYIAKYNVSTSTWSGFNSGISGPIFSIAIDSANNVYVGGQFQYAYNSTTGETTNNRIYANRIAKWNGSLWSALGVNTSAASTNGGGTSGDVQAIQIMSNNSMYVGGQFQQVTNVSTTNVSTNTQVSFIALYNINENKWYSVCGGLYTRVNAIATNSGNTTLIAGGTYSSTQTTTTYTLAL